MQVNVHEAKTNLSRLIAKAMQGQDVVIAKAGGLQILPVQIWHVNRVFELSTATA